jgi:hypothetical protein
MRCWGLSCLATSMTSWAVCSPAQRSPTPGRYLPILIPSALPKLLHPSSKSSHGTLFSQHTEALLYGFQSIAETIDVNYSDVVPGLIGLIPRISISNVQLADTVMFTIGEAWHTSMTMFSELQHPSLSMAGLGPVQTQRDTSSPIQSALQPTNCLASAGIFSAVHGASSQRC